MNEPRVSKLPDSDMQSALAALLRAARKAREIARQTGTAIVVMRDGKLCDEIPAAGFMIRKSELPSFGSNSGGIRQSRSKERTKCTALAIVSI